MAWFRHGNGDLGLDRLEVLEGSKFVGLLRFLGTESLQDIWVRCALQVQDDSIQLSSSTNLDFMAVLCSLAAGVDCTCGGVCGARTLAMAALQALPVLLPGAKACD